MERQQSDTISASEIYEELNDVENSELLQPSTLSVQDDENEPDPEIEENMDSRQRLAITLMNWSSIPENDQHMLQEGAIQALIQLTSYDNDNVKKCVASAFYHLSSREANRLEMLRLGSVNGLVAIAMRPSKWQVAKLCALSLCNLSMSQNEESALAENGSILALVILLGLRGHRLLPVCVQALYNLTSCGWTQHFKPETMRKVVKALMNVPQTFFDHQIYLCKAILNISRFSWVRSRMLEDGALYSIITFTESIPNRTDKEINSHYAISVIRMFSENQSGKAELINKGVFRPLKNIQKYCDRDTTLQLVLTVFNTIQLPMSSTNIEIAGIIISYILHDSHVVTENDLDVYQYCAACLYIFCQQSQKFSASTFRKILKSVTGLLGHANEFIQACIIPSCANLFFNKHLRALGEETREFISKFTTTAPSITDMEATVNLATTIAKLAHESFYMTILSESGLLNPLLKLLLDLDKKLKKNYSVKESVCVSITHIALNMKTLPGFVDLAMADILTDLLNEDDLDLVRNAICAIRSLSQINLCQEELMSDEVTIRIATVIETYPNDAILVRNSLAVLAVFSYNPEAHEALSVPEVIQILYKLSSSDDTNSRELVATSLCNLSITAKSRKALMKSKIIGVLEYLSGTTSELIQELVSKCICNLTYQPLFHKQMISEGVLNIIMIISLVRSISTVTKQLCARSFLNLLTNENLKDIKDSGALRIFANLSVVESPGLQNICARGFLVLTGTVDKREILLHRPLFLQALFSMVNCISEQARMMIGMAICNLLCCPTAQNMAISCGGVSVLKVLAVTDIEDMKESIARVSINLVSEISLNKVLLEESLVSVLILFLQQDSKRVFDIAIHAISCMTQMSDYHTQMIDEGVVTSLVSAVISGKWDTAIFALRVCQIFCLLSYSYERSESMVFESQIGLAFHVLYRNQICTPKTACLIAICLRNLSFDSKSRVQLIKQNCLRLLAAMLTDVFANAKNEFTFVRQCVLPFLHNICLEKSLHDEIIKQGLMKLLYILTFGHASDVNSDSDSDVDKEEVADEFENEKHLKRRDNERKISLTGPPAIVMLKECISNKSFMSDSSLGLANNTSTIENNGNVSGSTAYVQVEDYYGLPNENPKVKKSMELMVNDIHHIAHSISLVCDTESCHRTLIDLKCVKIFSYLVDKKYIIDLSRHQIATAICKLASTKSVKDKQNLSDQGAAEILMSIANTVARPDTKQQCSLALGFLSDITKVNRGVVESLLTLSKLEKDKMDKTSNTNTETIETENVEESADFDTLSLADKRNSFLLSGARSSMTGSKLGFETLQPRHDTNNTSSSSKGHDSNSTSSSSKGGFDTSSTEGLSKRGLTGKEGISLLKKRMSLTGRASFLRKNSMQDLVKETVVLARQSSAKTKSDRNFLLLAGITINQNPTSEDIENAILPKKGFKISKDEIDMCFVDYSLYLYNVFESVVKSELAGHANKVHFPNLSLPKATVRQGNDLSNRYTNLPSVPQITEPLPKDLTPVSLTMDFKDQRDDVQTEEAGDTMLDLPEANVDMNSFMFNSKNGKSSAESKSKNKFRTKSQVNSKNQTYRKASGDSSRASVYSQTGGKGNNRASVNNRRESNVSSDTEDISEENSDPGSSSRLSSHRSSDPMGSSRSSAQGSEQMNSSRLSSGSSAHYRKSSYNSTPLNDNVNNQPGPLLKIMSQKMSRSNSNSSFPHSPSNNKSPINFSKLNALDSTSSTSNSNSNLIPTDISTDTAAIAQESLTSSVPTTDV